MRQLNFIPVERLPEITPETDIVCEVLTRLRDLQIELDDGDVVVLASKIVAKSEACTISYADVSPGRWSRAVAQATGRDARELEVMLAEGEKFVGALPVRLIYNRGGRSYFGRTGNEAERALARMPSLLWFEKGGRLVTEAGIDESNTPGEKVISLLPAAPHESARQLALGFEKQSGKRVAVIISDSEVRIMRPGSLDIGLGWWGISPLRRDFGRQDRHGLAKFGGVDHIVDALCAATGLLMGQTDESIPAVIVRGLDKKYLRLERSSHTEPVHMEEKGPRMLSASSLVIWGYLHLLWSRLKASLLFLNPFLG